ncbi:MAG: cold shock domain-containing protein [Nitrospirota bacterium]
MREIGIVKWYDTAEGSGYIARKKGEDVYVHHSAVQVGPLREGAAVEFTLVEDDDGFRAKDVVIL